MTFDQGKVVDSTMTDASSIAPPSVRRSLRASAASQKSQPAPPTPQPVDSTEQDKDQTAEVKAGSSTALRRGSRIKKPTSKLLQGGHEDSDQANGNASPPSSSKGTITRKSKRSSAVKGRGDQVEGEEKGSKEEERVEEEEDGEDGEEEKEEEEEEDDKEYCVCKGKDDGRPMVWCVECDDWFHFKCVGLTQKEAKNLVEYVCAACSEKTGNLSKRNQDIQVSNKTESTTKGSEEGIVKRRPPSNRIRSRSSRGMRSEENLEEPKEDCDDDVKSPPSPPPQTFHEENVDQNPENVIVVVDSVHDDEGDDEKSESVGEIEGHAKDSRRVGGGGEASRSLEKERSKRRNRTTSSSSSDSGLKRKKLDEKMEEEEGEDGWKASKEPDAKKGRRHSPSQQQALAGSRQRSATTSSKTEGGLGPSSPSATSPPSSLSPKRKASLPSSGSVDGVVGSKLPATSFYAVAKSNTNKSTTATTTNTSSSSSSSSSKPSNTVAKQSSRNSSEEDAVRKHVLGKFVEVLFQILSSTSLVETNQEAGGAGGDQTSTISTTNPTTATVNPEMMDGTKGSCKERSEEYAARLESELFTLHGERNSKGGGSSGVILSAGKAYKDRFRTLLFNLKDQNNTSLHLRIASGSLKPQELARLSNEDLANEKIRLATEEAKREALFRSTLKKETANPTRKMTHKGEVDIDREMIDGGGGSGVNHFGEVDRPSSSDGGGGDDQPTSNAKRLRSSSVAEKDASPYLAQRQRTATLAGSSLIRDLDSDESGHLLSSPRESTADFNKAVEEMTKNPDSMKSGKSASSPPPSSSSSPATKFDFSDIWSSAPSSGGGGLGEEDQAEDQDAAAAKELGFGQSPGGDGIGGGGGGGLYDSDTFVEEAAKVGGGRGVIGVEVGPDRGDDDGGDVDAGGDGDGDVGFEFGEDSKLGEGADDFIDSFLAGGGGGGGGVDHHEDQDVVMDEAVKETKDGDREGDVEGDRRWAKGSGQTRSTTTPDVEPPSWLGLRHLTKAVWKGALTMPDFGTCTGTVRQVAGRELGLDPWIWSQLFPSPQNLIQGRLPSKAAIDYLLQVRQSSRTETIALVMEETFERQALEGLGSSSAAPGTEEENRKSFKSLVDYFLQKQRYGVLSCSKRAKGSVVKDFYIAPLSKDEAVPEWLRLMKEEPFGRGHDLKRERDYFVIAAVVHRGTIEAEANKERQRQRRSKEEVGVASSSGSTRSHDPSQGVKVDLPSTSTLVGSATGGKAGLGTHIVTPPPPPPPTLGTTTGGGAWAGDVGSNYGNRAGLVAELGGGGGGGGGGFTSTALQDLLKSIGKTTASLSQQQQQQESGVGPQSTYGPEQSSSTSSSSPSFGLHASATAGSYSPLTSGGPPAAPSASTPLPASLTGLLNSNPNLLQQLQSITSLNLAPQPNSDNQRQEEGVQAFRPPPGPAPRLQMPVSEVLVEGQGVEWEEEEEEATGSGQASISIAGHGQGGGDLTIL
ncbi:hypothetical protein IE53DRAFT_377314 [Violaceomyces palustris]|uniref:Uncharacterized protein n=1 Tax=Violaceomyces palustris TaxID=1673888 RepID=A0ACD0P606_9BASI|nr:hypothetical protein IE53DRAFT_377314 [Violaceomyces palustris]